MYIQFTYCSAQHIQLNYLVKLASCLCINVLQHITKHATTRYTLILIIKRRNSS